MKIVDIAFIVFATTVGSWLIWEFIPDHVKKYWSYIRQSKRDRKVGLKGKYIWTWRRK